MVYRRSVCRLQLPAPWSTRWHRAAQAEAALRLPALIEAERTIAECTQSESQRLI
jgi:hypothetical protein